MRLAQQSRGLPQAAQQRLAGRAFGHVPVHRGRFHRRQIAAGMEGDAFFPLATIHMRLRK
jgi:hypothetical protein